MTSWRFSAIKAACYAVISARPVVPETDQPTKDKGHDGPQLPASATWDNRSPKLHIELAARLPNDGAQKRGGNSSRGRCDAKRLPPLLSTVSGRHNQVSQSPAAYVPNPAKTARRERRQTCMKAQNHPKRMRAMPKPSFKVVIQPSRNLFKPKPKISPHHRHRNIALAGVAAPRRTLPPDLTAYRGRVMGGHTGLSPPCSSLSTRARGGGSAAALRLGYCERPLQGGGDDPSSKVLQPARGREHVAVAEPSRKPGASMGPTSSGRRQPTNYEREQNPSRPPGSDRCRSHLSESAHQDLQ
ncbi:predicted protein [Chaetomium globosum CBS 148.51]|uniref:Uncharacterized protein n=1 Tax=Chaetomium globosum (strain ATCC 6205 / CBS 148.51 / DSM 1962 / NBRC 6347 / NRRL 1970) TaxID=306901 RepID=Q2HGD1_CHAGB|nr:uncharacterized protein CHGG_00723 [Chaetomium globosum CBS 148.51]EAQ92488.1 predicted protein [Chaetomium globosum CBS 148.51]